MGVGVPEYVLLFRKPPTDSSDGYADTRVTKNRVDYYDPGWRDNEQGYTLGRWQVDAHGFWRTGGQRHLTPDELAGLDHAQMFRLYRKHNLANPYDYEDHVALNDALGEQRRLPTDFMLLQPPSWHPDVWTDVARMRTLNTVQAVKGKEQHLCPLPWDIVDRLIHRWSNPGDVVLDPFGGIMTIPYCAAQLGRSSVGIELNPVYWRDGIAHVRAVAEDLNTPSLFDILEDSDA